MKIIRISWENYKGLADGEIVANGQNVRVSGRNGSGKSSIASILSYIFFGKNWDGNSATKLYVNGKTTNKAQFDAIVVNLTHGGGDFVFNSSTFVYSLSVDVVKLYRLLDKRNDLLADFRHFSNPTANLRLSLRSTRLRLWLTPPLMKNIKPISGLLFYSNSTVTLIPCASVALLFMPH